MAIATREGKIRIFNQLQDTPPTTINSKTIVQIQDISAAPAFDRASISPLRTCKPNCAMVAVLETKPEAIEDSIRAFLVEKKRFAICARACTTKRSEEHTSELQSRENLVCRLLLEKKKMNTEL